MADLKKFKNALVLFGLVLAAVGVLFFSSRPGMLFFLLLWLVGEWVLTKKTSLTAFNHFLISKTRTSQRRDLFPHLTRYFTEWTPSSVLLLEEAVKELKNSLTYPQEHPLSQEHRGQIEGLAHLVEFRKLLTLSQSARLNKVRQLFVLNKTFRENTEQQRELLERMEAQDIMESAILVANLYNRVGEIAKNSFDPLQPLARKVLEASFGVCYAEIIKRHLIDSIVDQIQQNEGISFVVLNLIREGQLASARTVSHRLLKEQWELEEDLSSALYWLIELRWFNEEMQDPIQDFETSLRYLYHICFTAPERAHFLEVDSQYFSQFEAVNELAREAFLFKENLICRFLDLWKRGEGFFDPVFREVLGVMTQLKSKIYDDYNTWENIWEREREGFSKDYLYVVEGNLSYSSGYVEQAKFYYEKALDVNSYLRAALLNSIFVYAKLGAKEKHRRRVEEVLSRQELFPSSLSVVGNSYLLIGKDTEADHYYQRLQQVAGWGRKSNLYRSTFCFENRLFEKALLFARLAEKENPGDSSVLYHLSLCYGAVGEKTRALETVKKLETGPHWINYYRFTLERDVGKIAEAAQTLLTMPANYFEDPEELEEALTFAKNQKDLRLLRHLKSRCR